jgi:hypothetical protein
MGQYPGFPTTPCKKATTKMTHMVSLARRLKVLDLVRTCYLLLRTIVLASNNDQARSIRNSLGTVKSETHNGVANTHTRLTTISNERWNQVSD